MRGFTLIEVLITLMLIGLVASIAVPRMERLYTSSVMNFEKDDIFHRIAALGFKARETGEEIRLGISPPPEGGPKESSLLLPEGWSFSADSPIIYQTNGVCRGGVGVLHYRDLALTLTLKPPYCRP